MRKITGFGLTTLFLISVSFICHWGGSTVDSALEPTPVTIQGVVLTPEGTLFHGSPQSGALIKVFSSGPGGALIAGSELNDDGSFMLTQVIPDGEYSVYAVVDGIKNPYLDSKPVIIRIQRGVQPKIELTLTAPAIKGRVFKPDQTVFTPGYESGVSVYLTTPGSSAVLVNGIVSEDGSYKLGGDLETGDYLLHARARGISNLYGDSKPLKVRIEPGKLQLLDLHLTYPLIQGMVLKPNGIPYTITPGIEIMVWLKQLEENGETCYYSVQNNGSYKVGNLPPGDYLLGATIRGNDHNEADSIPIKVRLEAGFSSIQNITLTIPSITGRVFTPDNKIFLPGPESGVDLLLLSSDGVEKEVTRASLRKDGSYGFGGNIPTGKYTILAQVKGKEMIYTDALPVKIQFVAGRLLVQDLRLTSPLIKGRVLKPDGEPFIDKPDSWVSVNLSKFNSNTKTLDTVAVSGLSDGGSFKFGGPIPGGEYLLTAESKGNANPFTGSKPVTVHVNAGQLALQDLSLSNPVLKGRVVKPDGAPLEPGSGQDLSIHLRPFAMAEDQTRIFPVNQDGSYRVGNIPLGTYRVWAQVEGPKNPFYDSEPVLVRLNGEQTVNQDLTLTQPLIIGKVRSPDGKLYTPGLGSGVEILLKSAGADEREVARVKLYAGSSYRLGGKIPPGDYRLYALALGDLNPYLDAEPIRIHVSTGFVIEQDLRLTNPSVTGQVLTPEGSAFLPKKEATVEVFLKPGVNGTGHTGRIWKAIVSDIGGFKLGGAPLEGDYLLCAQVRGNNNPYADAIPLPVSLKTGRILKQNISLVHPTVTGAILDPNGTPLTTFFPGEVYLQVQSADSSGELHDFGQIPVNGAGTFNLGLPSGRYQLSAVVETSRIPYSDSIPVPVYVETGKTIKQDLRLSRPIISGKVLTPGDRLFIPGDEKWVRVRLKALENNTYMAVKEVNSDGSYKMGGAIPAGDYLLEAEAGGLKNSYTDGEPVAIQVAPGKAVEQNLTLSNPMITGKVLTPGHGALDLDEEAWTNVYLTTLSNPNPIVKKAVYSDGSFRLGGSIPPGYYLLHAETGGPGNGYTNAVPLNVQLEAGKILAINIPLTRPALSGKILITSGKVFLPGPESWATVSLKTSETPSREVASTLVNADGSYRLGGGVFAGEYLIFVTAGGRANPYNDAAPVPVQLEENQLLTKDLNLGPLNSPPVFTPTGIKHVNEGELLQFVLKAVDPDGQPLTYTFTNMPLGASYNSTMNSFSWSPYYFQAGSYKIQAMVSDGKLTDRQTITIVVNDVTPVSLIRKLAKYIEATDLPTPEKEGLLDKLDQAMQSLGKKEARTAIEHINQLIDDLDELQNQVGSKLTPEKAGELISIAQNIIYVIQL